MSEAITRRRFIWVGAVAAVAVATGAGVKVAAEQPEVEHPSMRIGAGVKKVLVVYGTKSGCSAGVAERIGSALAVEGVEVDVVPAEKAGDPAPYAAVIVGSGVRMGQWHEPARAWVAAHAEALRDKPLAFYTVGLTLVTDPNKAGAVCAYTDPLIAETGVKPVDVGLFKGRSTGEGFSFIERAIIGAMKVPKGDFRDWAEIDAWALKVAPLLSTTREQSAGVL
jgi:menaquinone-dependent protoporphyrinogen oxidase